METRRRIGKILLVLPGVLWVLTVIWFEGFYLFFLVGLATLFHECGHLLAFSLLGLPQPKIRPVARGLRLFSDAPLSYRDELIVAAAGPAANLVCHAAGALFGSRIPALSDFGEMSLLTALCNLIPMGELDGERILVSLLSRTLDEGRLFGVRRVLSFITLFLCLFTSLSLLWISGDALYTAFLSIGALFALPTGTEYKEMKRFQQIT